MPSPRDGAWRRAPRGEGADEFAPHHRQLRLGPGGSPGSDAASGESPARDGVLASGGPRPVGFILALRYPRCHEFDWNFHRDRFARDERLLAHEGRSAGSGIAGGPVACGASGGGVRPGNLPRSAHERRLPLAQSRLARRAGRARRGPVRARLAGANALAPAGATLASASAANASAARILPGVAIPAGLPDAATGSAIPAEAPAAAIDAAGLAATVAVAIGTADAGTLAAFATVGATASAPATGSAICAATLSGAVPGFGRTVRATAGATAAGHGATAARCAIRVAPVGVLSKPVSRHRAPHRR